jgi:hypothetical protein
MPPPGENSSAWAAFFGCGGVGTSCAPRKKSKQTGLGIVRDVNPQSNESQRLWNQIVADFRLACFLRREGKQSEATQIIQEKLPLTIARWSQVDSRSSSDKQAALKTMFATEQGQSESSDYTPQALAAKLADSLLPALRRHVSEELREGIAQQFRSWQNNFLLSNRASGNGQSSRRVRFDDIPGVIDVLLAEQSADWAPPQRVAC